MLADVYKWVLEDWRSRIVLLLWLIEKFHTITPVRGWCVTFICLFDCFIQRDLMLLSKPCSISSIFWSCHRWTSRLWRRVGVCGARLGWFGTLEVGRDATWGTRKIYWACVLVGIATVVKESSQNFGRIAVSSATVSPLLLAAAATPVALYT